VFFSDRTRSINAHRLRKRLAGHAPKSADPLNHQRAKVTFRERGLASPAAMGRFGMEHGGESALFWDFFAHSSAHTAGESKERALVSGAVPFVACWSAYCSREKCNMFLES
jgi:hypothetical protein